MSIIRPAQLYFTSKPSRVLNLESGIRSHQGTTKPTQYHFNNIFHKEPHFHKEFNFPFSSSRNPWKIVLSKPKEEQYCSSHSYSSISVFSYAIPVSKKSRSLCTRYSISYEPVSSSSGVIN